MKRKFLPANPFQKAIEQILFKLKVLSIWRLQYFLVFMKAGTVKRIEWKNNTTRCFTE
jgi:hypothetical protein